MFGGGENQVQSRLKTSLPPHDFSAVCVHSLSSLHRPSHHFYHHQIFSHQLHHKKPPHPPSDHQEPSLLAFSLLCRFYSSLPSAATDHQLPHRSSRQRRQNYLLNLLITVCCDVADAQINYPSFKHNTQNSIEQARGRSHGEDSSQIFMLDDMQFGGGGFECYLG